MASVVVANISEASAYAVQNVENVFTGGGDLKVQLGLWRDTAFAILDLNANNGQQKPAYNWIVPTAYVYEKIPLGSAQLEHRMMVVEVLTSALGVFLPVLDIAQTAAMVAAYNLIWT